MQLNGSPILSQRSLDRHPIHADLADLLIKGQRTRTQPWISAPGPDSTVQCRRNRYFPLRCVFLSLREGSHALFCPEPIRMTWIRCAGWRGVKTPSCQETHSQFAATEGMLCLYYMYYTVNTSKSLIWIKDLTKMTEAVFGERKIHYTSCFFVVVLEILIRIVCNWLGAIKILIRSWGKFGITLADWLK